MIKSLATVMLLLLATAMSMAEKAEPFGALAKMPVKEVTIFKDGHAFLLHEGKMPTDAEGNVVLDNLPQPVIGTFWPYIAKGERKLNGVRAGQRKVAVEQTALTNREMLEGNIGAAVIVTETDGKRYHAVIEALPTRSTDELEATTSATARILPQRGNLVMLKTEDGHRMVNIDRIQDLTFVAPPNGKHIEEVYRNLLTLQVDWNGHQPEKTADVGMVYLQKGIRWIPSYKVMLDGKGTATVMLQGTLLDELTDLNDVTANLVIGVPTFAFKDTIDPIALQQMTAQLSPYFNQNSQTAYAFSNAIMTQQARMGDYHNPDDAHPSALDLGPDIANNGKSEDLFIFTLKHITMRTGERIVVPIATFTVKYQDVYTVDLPFAPPQEMLRNIGSSQQIELARPFIAPKAMHMIRLVNTTTTPFTTAPALILDDDRVLAQGMMTYASPGGSCDLPITTAVDIPVKKKDVEIKRTPNAITYNNNSFARVDLKGTVTLTNMRDQPVTLEITRGVLGTVTTADHDGTIQQIGPMDDDQTLLPSWVYNYNWSGWWSHLNGSGTVKWTITLPAGKSVDLSYDWYYYWG